MSTESSITTPAQAAPPARGVVRGPHQAIVVVERRMARGNDTRAEQFPPGWRWVLGNARIGDLYDRIFDEAGLTWSCMVVPEEHQATFAAMAPPGASAQPIMPYNGQLQFKPESLTWPPDGGEPLYLFFNGRRFPICDVNQAIVAHRQGRCDVTLIDFPTLRKKTYDESLRMDADGCVQRVDRTYTAAGPEAGHDRDWPAIVVVSGPSMQQLMGVELPQRLNQWPAAMLRAGLRLRGCTIPGRSFNLHEREHLHELNEVLLRLKPEWLCQAGGLIDQGEKIFVGRNVRIDSRAQLIGPIALGDNVQIGADAVIVGPSAIGRNSTIGKGMILKRCVVLPDTVLASASQRLEAISHAIVLGSDTPSIHAVTPQNDGDEVMDFRTLSIDRPIRIETVMEAGTMPALSGARHRAFCAAKRLVDILMALLFLAFTLPFYPLLALAIKINSPGGPIFYGHIRQGRFGRNFRCWKFRTMVPDAEAIQRNLMARNEVDGPQFKIKEDPRIFFVGGWLRKLNIDEWPQFFNVLIGQMSIVGPRPSPDRENQMCPAWRAARLSVRPGITGLWQVMRGRDRGDTDFQEWIYYDVQYVKKQSMWMDLKILLKTFGVMFGGR